MDLLSCVKELLCCPLLSTFVILPLTLITLHFLKRRYARKRLKEVPGVSLGHWFWGWMKEGMQNLHRIHEHKIDCYNHGSENLGTYTRMPPIWHWRYVCRTREPANVKYILKDNYQNYLKGISAGDFILKGILDEGIFGINHGPHAKDNGKMWRYQRKIAARLFTNRNFNTLFEQTFCEHANKVAQVLEANANAAENTTVDVQALFAAFTMDSLGAIGFGIEMNNIAGILAQQRQDTTSQFVTKQSKKPLQSKPHNISNESLKESLLESGETPNRFSSKATKKFTVAFDTIQTKVISRFRHPFWWSKFGWFLYSAEREIFRLSRVLYDFSQAVIDQRRKIGYDGKSDILSMFLQAADVAKEEKNVKKVKTSKLLESASASKKFKGAPLFSDRTLQDIVLSFIIAGRDTTAAMLTWVFYELSQHPMVEKKLVDELNERLQGRKPTRNDLHPNVMPYLHAVLHETLRLHPSVPSDFKVAYQDDVLPDNTTILAGSKVEFSIYCMGRDPHIWGDDSLVFRPERWLRHIDGKVKDENGVFYGLHWKEGKPRPRCSSSTVTRDNRSWSHSSDSSIDMSSPSLSSSLKKKKANSPKHVSKSKIAFVQANQYEFPVFQAGPRICLGQKMALFEASTLLATVLPKFHLESPTFSNIKNPPQYVISVILWIKDGLPMKARLRKK
eukprot:g5326.t1